MTVHDDIRAVITPARLAVVADAGAGRSMLAAFAATLDADPRAQIVAWLWAGPSAPPPTGAASVIEIAPSSDAVVLDEGVGAALRPYDTDAIVDLTGTADLAGAGRPPSRRWRIARRSAAGLEAGTWGGWEVHDGAPITTTLLLGGPAGAGIVKEATLRTRTWSLAANAAQVGRVAAQMVAWAATGEPDAPTLEAATAPTSRRVLEGQSLLKARLRARFEWGRRALTSLGRREQWATGVWPHPIATLLDASTIEGVQWAPEPGDHRFLADPHGFDDGGRVSVLVEDLDVRDGRGVISALDYHDGAFSSPRTVIEEPVHLSYPFILAVDGARYCVPESSAGGELVLYRPAPGGAWERAATLVRGRRLVDASFLHHEGRWWMWAGDVEASDNATLTLWSADDLLGPWIEHPASPVAIDVRRARPAGTLFVHEGRLYRPGQDCSVTYGGRVTLCEVMTLTPDRYAERVVRSIEPSPTGRYRAGFHTVSAVGGVTLVDGKRFVRNSPADLRRALTRGLSRLRR